MRPTRLRAAFLMAVVLASATLVLAAPACAAWSFAVPEGWSDLSPGKPVPKGVPEAVAAQTQSGVYAFYAMDLGGAKDGFAENVNAVVNPGTLVANERSLGEYVATLPAQASRELPGGSIQVVEKSVVAVAGVDSLRILCDVDAVSLKLRTLQYIVPGGDNVAVITYSSTPKEFARYLPVFEAAVQKTRGAAAAPMAAKVGQKLLDTGVSAHDWQAIFTFVGRIIGIVVALVVISVVSRLMKRKKATS